MTTIFDQGCITFRQHVDDALRHRGLSTDHSDLVCDNAYRLAVAGAVARLLWENDSVLGLIDQEKLENLTQDVEAELRKRLPYVLMGGTREALEVLASLVRLRRAGEMHVDARKAVG